MSRGAAFESSALGFRCSALADTWWSVYLFHDSLSVTKKIKKAGLGLHHCTTDSHFQSYRNITLIKALAY